MALSISIYKSLLKAHRCRYYGSAIQPPSPTVRAMYGRKQKELGPMAWLLLMVPVSAFGLGTWQVKRKRWKEKLVDDLAARTSLPPVELPHDLSELSAMEYHTVKVKGQFDHSRELYIGPRSLLAHGDSASSSSGSIISSAQSGYHVITPFKLADREGWVPQKQKKPESRLQGQAEGELELVGVVRHSERRQPLTPENTPQSGYWLYRDLDKMAEMAGTSAHLLDAVESSTVPGGPIGGQTRIALRNEHLSYIFTWYGLSIATAYMWFNHFIRRAPKL